MNPPNRTNEDKPISVVLGETFDRDQAAVARALDIPPQHVSDWTRGERRNPFEAAAVVIEVLRQNGNPHADEPFLAIARRLGFVAYRNEHASADRAFAEVLREVSDVVAAKADAEGDGAIDPRERRNIAQQLSELIERAAQYRDEQLAKATADEAKSRSRNFNGWNR
jgi:hypothetical protein